MLLLLLLIFRKFFGIGPGCGPSKLRFSADCAPFCKCYVYWKVFSEKKKTQTKISEKTCIIGNTFVLIFCEEYFCFNIFILSLFLERYFHTFLKEWISWNWPICIRKGLRTWKLTANNDWSSATIIALLGSINFSRPIIGGCDRIFFSYRKEDIWEIKVRKVKLYRESLSLFLVDSNSSLVTFFLSNKFYDTV